MKAYFADSKYLNDRAVLLEVATEAGVPDAEAVIDDPTAYSDEVKKEMATYAKGVSGVPYFIVDGRFKMGGAQPPEAFSEIFEELAQEIEE